MFDLHFLICSTRILYQLISLTFHQLQRKYFRQFFPVLMQWDHVMCIRRFRYCIRRKLVAMLFTLLAHHQCVLLLYELACCPMQISCLQRLPIIDWRLKNRTTASIHATIHYSLIINETEKIQLKVSIMWLAVHMHKSAVYWRQF